MREGCIGAPTKIVESRREIQLLLSVNGSSRQGLSCKSCCYHKQAFASGSRLTGDEGRPNRRKRILHAESSHLLSGAKNWESWAGNTQDANTKQSLNRAIPGSLVRKRFACIRPCKFPVQILVIPFSRWGFAGRQVRQKHNISPQLRGLCYRTEYSMCLVTLKDPKAGSRGRKSTR